MCPPACIIAKYPSLNRVNKALNGFLQKVAVIQVSGSLQIPVYHVT